jgi:hypothetical protein
MKHRARAPHDANVPGFQHCERHEGGVQQVAQFMSQEPEAPNWAAESTSRRPSLCTG